MKDVRGTELWPGCYAVMWSDNQGKQLLVQVVDFNPDTKKVKVIRQDEPGPYEMKTFWTNDYEDKFWLLPS